jgi:PAS domain S-box-containing protein
VGSEKKESGMRRFSTKTGTVLVAALAVIFILMAVFGCRQDTANHVDSRALPSYDGAGALAPVSPFTSFRDIPGVTAEETAAIEALQREHESFSYGMTLSTEAFITESGVGGYSVFLCEWLSELFGIRFQPEVHAWNDLVEKLNAGELDFAGNMTPTEERMKIYLMTSPVADRQYKTIQLAVSLPLDRIALIRPLRYVFLEGTAFADTVASVTDSGTYTAIFVSNYEEAYRVLESGAADAFIGDSAVVSTFDIYGDMHTEDFLPLIFSPVSMATAKDEFSSVISLVTKALQNGARPYLNYLYNKGYEAYKKNKFFTQLSEEEKSYLQNTSSVPLAARYFNYPVDFYNTYEKKWEGIVFDVLAQVENITGLKFEVVNSTTTELSDLFNMVYDGRAHIMPELIYSERRAQYVIWTKHIFLADQLALLSTSRYPNVSANEIPYKRVGVIANTVRAEMFHTWFPSAENVIDYTTDANAMLALEQGEVDLVMSSKNRLLSFLNFQEISLFKVNYLFNYPYESTFGFYKEQTVLCSIMAKALPLVDTYMITEQWLTKTYDYRTRLMEAQRPWLIGATIMSLMVLTMMVVIFLISRNEGKRLAKLVAEKTSTLSAILDATPDLIFCKDLNMHHTECNKALERYLNVRKSDIIGKDDKEAFGMPQDMIDQFAAWDKKILDEKQANIVEEYILSASGEMRLFETIKSPLMHDGKVTGLVGMSRDITRRKAAEEEAKIASEAKSRFIANMSHEIRTPMNAILGITEIILRNETLPQDVTEALYKIYNSGDLLLYIINDILDLSKIEAGKLELVPVQYEVASMINDTVMLNMTRIGSKPIEFKLSVDENIPVHLLGDVLRIRQILNNVLSNAIKYTLKGEIKLSASVEKGSSESEVIIVYSVSDTGQGMTQEQINRLFDEYSRFNAEANRTTEGAGLGMSITQNLVQMMKGNISVESEPDKGTIVTVRLPQVKDSSDVIGKELAENLEKFERNAAKQIRKTQIIFEPMPYGSVLLVDDVASNLFVAEGLMFPYGLSIDTVSSGFGAIEKIKNGKIYDIVFMDHMMPKMDGIETTKKLREMGYTHPIVALTANAIIGQSNIFMENGFDGFVSKPIDIRQLNAMLKKFVRDKQPPEVIEEANRNKDIQENSGSGRVYSRHQLDEIFVRDASRLAKGLEELQEKGAYEEEEIRTYTINVHALKSALINVGETELSAVASRLEDAGRAKDTSVMTGETGTFLNDLWAVIDKHMPHQEDVVGGKPIVEDRVYLKEKLLAIKEACKAYDRKTIKEIITELRQKEWQRETKELLAVMDENLLNGDFDALSKDVEERIRR